MSKKKYFLLCMTIIFSLIVSSCIKKTVQSQSHEIEETQTALETINTKPTILEFGSSCVPCIKMKIILDILVEEHGDVIAVEFVDIGTDSGEKKAEENQIRIIPSQIFLDSDGIEFFRHDGYLSQEELLSLLKKWEIIK